MVTGDSMETTGPMDLSRLSDRARSDYALVRLAVDEGNQQAFAKLLQYYREPLVQLLYKMTSNRDDAEDLMMESFGKAFKSLAHYQPHYAFSTWLFRIATNVGIDYLRKRRLKTTSLDSPFKTDEGDEVGHDVSSGQPDPEETLIFNQKKLILRQVVDQLKPRYKQLIEMRYYEELSYEEIAEKLDIPLGTVKAQLFRAKELLHQILRVGKNKF
jgi:RNA polymerase sigma-70 factor (ECF subfamily)